MSRLEKLDPTLEYHFFENKAFIDDFSTEVRKKAFALWQTEWEMIYKSLESKKLPTAEDFQSYDLVNCLFSNNEIVGLTGHRFINLQDPISYETEFVKSLGKEFLDKISHLGLTRLMTFETLLVSPQYRKSCYPVPVSLILTHLANMIFSRTPAHSIVAAGRCDYKVGEMGQRIGYELILPKQKFRVFTCDLVVQRNKHIMYPQYEDWHIANELWKAGTGHFNESYVATQTFAQPQKIAKAA